MASAPLLGHSTSHFAVRRQTLLTVKGVNTVQYGVPQPRDITVLLTLPISKSFSIDQWSSRGGGRICLPSMSEPY